MSMNLIRLTSLSSISSAVQTDYVLWEIVGAIKLFSRIPVTVSTSAFQAYHQCCCAGSSLAWGLYVRALVCGIF